MSIRLSDKTRVAIAKNYIRVAGKLPFIKTDGFKAAREIKGYQIEDSEKAYLRSRPPDGIKIDYLYFRLIESFRIEEYDILVQGIYKLLTLRSWPKKA